MLQLCSIFMPVVFCLCSSNVLCMFWFTVYVSYLPRLRSCYIPATFQLCSVFVPMFRLCSGFCHLRFGYLPITFWLYSSYLLGLFCLCSIYVLCCEYHLSMSRSCFVFVPAVFNLCSKLNTASRIYLTEYRSIKLWGKGDGKNSLLVISMIVCRRWSY